MNPDQFQQKLAEHNIMLDEHQMTQFEEYYKLLVATNEHVNLTTITERDDVYLKHFYDSLTPAFYIEVLREQPISLCDVGAGAGFPSIPLKIAFPQLTVTIVDSLNKRITFLKELQTTLGLTNVHFHHARAEEFGGRKSEFRASFDIVTARAVAKMSVLSEFCLPLTKVGGQFVALKAAQADQDLESATTAIKLLGGEVKQDVAFELPFDAGTRHIVVINKEKKTPGRYPRKAGTPTREPLGSQNQ